MNEDGRILPKSVNDADQALKALTRRLDVLRGDSLGAITAGTLDQLGVEKAFEIGEMISNAAGFLPGRKAKREILRRERDISRQRLEMLPQRRAPMKEIGSPPRRAGRSRSRYELS